MKIINVRINLYHGVRTKPIKSGYRPLFFISEGKYLSGNIEITNKEKLYPGEFGEASILFINDHLIDLYEGKVLYFSEGLTRIGEAIVVNVTYKPDVGSL